MSINKEAFAKFADALDSGEYKQGYGVLCDQDGYCVWGVATDIVYEELGFTKVYDWEYAAYEKEEEGGFKYRGTFIPPSPVTRHYFGEEGSGTREEIFGKLLEMNDNKTHTFPEIAAYIREEILKED